mgnify:CR=1 FL=1
MKGETWLEKKVQNITVVVAKPTSILTHLKYMNKPCVHTI